MKTQHTPGPWQEMYNKSPNQWVVYGPLSEGERWEPKIANVIDSESDERAKANARLIAAAPELLEALEQISEILTKKRATDKDSMRACRNIANEAINKALIVS